MHCHACKWNCIRTLFGCICKLLKSVISDGRLLLLVLFVANDVCRSPPTCRLLCCLCTLPGSISFLLMCGFWFQRKIALLISVIVKVVLHHFNTSLEVFAQSRLVLRSENNLSYHGLNVLLVFVSGLLNTPLVEHVLWPSPETLYCVVFTAVCSVENKLAVWLQCLPLNISSAMHTQIVD